MSTLLAETVSTNIAVIVNTLHISHFVPETEPFCSQLMYEVCSAQLNVIQDSGQKLYVTINVCRKPDPLPHKKKFEFFVDILVYSYSGSNHSWENLALMALPASPFFSSLKTRKQIYIYSVDSLSLFHSSSFY